MIAYLPPQVTITIPLKLKCFHFCLAQILIHTSIPVALSDVLPRKKKGNVEYRPVDHGAIDYPTIGHLFLTVDVFIEYE